MLEYIANVKQERRDERKRKIEDRKRQREEEKQRKKSHIAKSIPKSIEEETKVKSQQFTNSSLFLKFLFFSSYRKTMMAL